MASRTRLYIGRLSSRTRERDLHDLFSRFGRIQSCDIKTGYGFVEFDDPRDAEDALHDLNNTTLDGSRIQVEFSKGPRQSGSRSSTGGSARSDYRVSVDNLPREMSWQDLKDRFRQVGDVVFADVHHERGGKIRGVVEFRSREDVKDAIRQLDGVEVRGSTIYVREDDGSGRSRGGSRSPRRSSGSRRRSRSPRRSSPKRRYSRSPPRRRRSPTPERRRSRSRDRSPRGRSPRKSPRRSPRAASPKASPKASPRAGSASPRSPRRGTNGDGNNSPREDSPRRRSSSPRRTSASPRRSPSRSPRSD